MINNLTISTKLIRSFGRVNGRKLRVGQTDLMENLLPKLAVDIEEKREREKGKENSLTYPFSGLPSPLYLEIGFGYGEHLVGLALRYPDVTFIGCEPFANGVATLLKQIQETKVENIRILHGDARLLIEKLPDSCIDRVFILFPDPWPKSKHHKKRIISQENLKNLARIIKKGGRLDIATDHVDYGIWIDEHLSASEEFKANATLGLDTIPDDWVETRYQKKARAQGRGARFFNYSNS